MLRVAEVVGRWGCWDVFGVECWGVGIGVGVAAHPLGHRPVTMRRYTTETKHFLKNNNEPGDSIRLCNVCMCPHRRAAVDSRGRGEWDSLGHQRQHRKDGYIRSSR